MSTQLQTESGGRVAASWILPGLIAGLVFAMWAMMVGRFTSNLWAAPQGIAQSVGMTNSSTVMGERLPMASMRLFVPWKTPFW